MELLHSFTFNSLEGNKPDPCQSIRSSEDIYEENKISSKAMDLFYLLSSPNTFNSREDE